MLHQQARSLRSFIGSLDYGQSREFYRRLGFAELELSERMCYFKVNDKLGFYLQDYHVADWVQNSMIFLEVVDVEESHRLIQSLDLPGRFPNVRLSEIKEETWGKEFFLHDPSGVLWHIGAFLPSDS
ncbi:MAG: glyoxalase [Planctomycetota bacterium]